MAEDETSGSSDRIWQCPADAMIGGAEWVAKTDKPPIEEFRKTARESFEWFDIESTDATQLEPQDAEALIALGFRPRGRHSTKTPFATAGLTEFGFPSEYRWEHWRSDDGVTTTDVMLGEGAPTFAGFDTRFDEGTLVFLPEAPIARKERNEYGLMSGNLAADYSRHRARVQERVEAGELAISVAAPADREAYLNYYADHLSGKELADSRKLIEQMPAGGDGGVWWMLPVFAVLLLLGTIISFLMAGRLVPFAPYWDWLLVWWPIAIVTVGPQILTQYVTLAFQGHMNHLDHKYPDSLEHHAGYWIKGRIAAEGLAEEVEVGRAKEPAFSGLDAYLPLRNKIVLGEKTYEKQDPTFWAIAAHELGHAIDWRSRPAMRPLSLGSRVAFRKLMGWSSAVLLANSFFGWDVANEAWVWLLVGALATGMVVLVDEAIASIIGLRILRADSHITDDMIVDLRRHLGLAFATYFAPVVALAGILIGSDWITGYIQTHAVFEPASPLYPGRTDLGNVLSLVVLAGVFVVEHQRLKRWALRLLGRDSAPAEEPFEDGDPKTRFCAKCGTYYAALDECPLDGTPLIEVGAPDEGEEPQPSVDGKKIVWGCLGILAGLAAATGFFLEVWDQPLGSWYRAAVFAYAPIVTFLLAPALIPVTLLLQLPRLVINKLGLVPKPPDETPLARAKEAADDAVSEIKVADPRQGTPWYIDVASPGLLLHAMPLIVLWWASQL